MPGTWFYNKKTPLGGLKIGMTRRNPVIYLVIQVIEAISEAFIYFRNLKIFF